jgi:hypothetical protein
VKNLLQKISGWKNQDCGDCRQTMIELLNETEDVLTLFAPLGKAVTLYRASIAEGYAATKARRDAVVIAAMRLGDRFNGED